MTSRYHSRESCGTSASSGSGCADHVYTGKGADLDARPGCLGQGRPGDEDAARIQPGRNYFGTLPRERHVPGARGAVEWRWTLGAIINAVALPLIRITETSTGQTWNHLRAELQRIHPGTFTHRAVGHKHILKALNLPEPRWSSPPRPQRPG